MMAVLVEERARDAEVLAHRDDHAAARPGLRVAGGRRRSAEGPDARLRDDQDRDGADLVSVRRRTEERGIPVDVDVLGLDVERDRPALRILPGDDLGAGARRKRRGSSSRNEKGDAPAPSRFEVVAQGHSCGRKFHRKA
jgi:hypothetical protein